MSDRDKWPRRNRRKGPPSRRKVAVICARVPSRFPGPGSVSTIPGSVDLKGRLPGGLDQSAGRVIRKFMLDQSGGFGGWLRGSRCLFTRPMIDEGESRLPPLGTTISPVGWAIKVSRSRENISQTF